MIEGQPEVTGNQKKHRVRILGKLNPGQAVVSPYEVFDSLMDADNMTNIGLQLGEDIVHQILSPYEDDTKGEDITDTNLVVFMGEPGGSKTIASRQCILKTLANREMRNKLHNIAGPRGRKRFLTGVLVRRDDCLTKVKDALGIGEVDKNPLFAQALASYVMERQVNWAMDTLPHPLLIVIETVGLNLPGRDFGWDAIDALSQYQNIRTKVVAVIPNEKIQAEAFRERASLEDQALDRGAVKEDARQKVVRYRQSMSMPGSLKRTADLVFKGAEQLMEDETIQFAQMEAGDFKGDPEKEREVRKAFYRLHGRKLGLSSHSFYLVEGLWFDDTVDIHRYDDIFGKFPNKYSPPLVSGLVKDIVRAYRLETIRDQ